MPKRICPFEYDLLPQNKVHVSEKEVCDEESVKSLYDKTLKMLFVGARKVPNVTESRVAARIHLGCPVVKHKQHFSSPNMKHNYKQMFLDSQCQLQSLGTIKPEPRLHCENCKLPCSEIQSRCTFCDKFLCAHCVVTCAKCTEDFCNACSLATYSNLEDEHMCLGCCR